MSDISGKEEKTMNKKKQFFILLLGLVLFFSSGYGFSQQSQPTLQDLLTEQDQVLLNLNQSIEKIQKSNSSLQAQLESSHLKTIGLTNSLQNLTEKFGVTETQLMKSQENLKQAQQSVATLEQNSKQQQASLSEALSSINQSKKEYQKLQTENTIIKLVGGGLIIGLAAVVLLQAL